MLRHEEEGLQQLGAFENRSSRLSLSVFQHTRSSRTVLPTCAVVRSVRNCAEILTLCVKGAPFVFPTTLLVAGFRQQTTPALRFDVRVSVRVNERGV